MELWERLWAGFSSPELGATGITGFNLYSMFVAVVGAVVVLVVYHMIAGRSTTPESRRPADPPGAPLPREGGASDFARAYADFVEGAGRSAREPLAKACQNVPFDIREGEPQIAVETWPEIGAGQAEDAGFGHELLGDRRASHSR